MPSLFRHRDFRLLLLGQGTSAVGDRLVFVALAIYVTDIGTPSDVGLVLACHAVPLVGFLLVGGVWADRLPRHLVVVTTDLIRFALHALLAVLIFTGTVEIWHIAVIEACFGTAEAFFRPAVSGLVPQTVPEEEIQPARAALGTLETLAEFAGPALATALVLGIGPGYAFALDAATFLVSAAFLVRLQPRERGEPALRTTVLAELREGWTEVRSHTWIWVIVAAFSFALLTAFGPWMTLGPTVSIERYDTAAIYGVLVSAMGAGTIVGALIGFRWRPGRPMRTAMLLALPFPAVFGAFAFGLPAPVLLPIFVLAGTGIALFDVWWHTALAQRVPPHMLSRVTSYDWMGSLALLPIGYVLAGPLGEALGATEVLAAGGGLALAALALTFASREVRELRGAPPADAPHVLRR
jgi:MFS family permease